MYPHGSSFLWSLVVCLLKNPGEQRRQERTKRQGSKGGEEKGREKREWREGNSRQKNKGENWREDVLSMPVVPASFKDLP